jgi:hypothetical protein
MTWGTKEGSPEVDPYLAAFITLGGVVVIASLHR